MPIRSMRGVIAWGVIGIGSVIAYVALAIVGVAWQDEIPFLALIVLSLFVLMSPTRR